MPDGTQAVTFPRFYNPIATLLYVGMSTNEIGTPNPN